MMRRLAWLLLAVVGMRAATGAADAAPLLTVRVANPLPQARTDATVVLRLAELRRLAPTLEPAETVVVDAKSVEVLSQLVDMDGDAVADEIIFQDDFAPRESK